MVPALSSPEQITLASGKRRMWRSLFAATMLIAAVLRFGPVCSGLPYIGYIDEGHPLHMALTVLNTHSYDTGFYGYPGLPSYLVAAGALLYSPLYAHVHGRTLWQDLAPGRHLSSGSAPTYDLIYPPEIVLVGRLIIAAISLATVVTAGVLAKRIGGPGTAAWAMLLTAVCPALVTRASIVIIDTPAAFFTTAALCFSERLRFASTANVTWQRLNAFCAGAMAGFAYGSKYAVGLVFVAVLLAIALSVAGAMRKFVTAVVAGAGLIVACILSTPALVFDPEKIVSSLRVIAAFYDTISDSPGYWRQAISLTELGIPLIGAAFCGFAFMLWDRTVRVVAFTWLAFFAVMLAAFVPQSFEPLRNLLPLVPLVCVAAAVAVVQLHRWAVSWSRNPAVRWLPSVAAAALLIMPTAISSAQQTKTRMALVDSRRAAIDWLARHTGAADVVLTLEEIALLPPEHARVPARLVMVPWRSAAEALRRGGFTYVVTSEFELQYAADQANVSAVAREWLELTSSMSVEAAFGTERNPLVPYYWRTNDQRLLVLKPNAPGGIAR